MYIVYHDVGGTHSTVVAAAIHLNRLPMQEVPSRDEILNLPLFDKLEKKDIGRLMYHGTDEYGHFVCTISRKYQPQIVVNALMSVFDIADMDPKQILCVDTSPAVNNWMRLGGGSSRKFGLVSFGRPIVAYGTIKAYPKIAEIVKKTKLKIAP